MSWNSRSKEISSTTDEVRVKVAAGDGRQVLVARVSGTFVGTLKIQKSTDGKTFTDATVTNVVSGVQANPTGTGVFAADLAASAVAGRVIFSAYTSGAARIEALNVPFQA